MRPQIKVLLGAGWHVVPFQKNKQAKPGSYIDTLVKSFAILCVHYVSTILCFILSITWNWSWVITKQTFKNNYYPDVSVWLKQVHYHFLGRSSNVRIWSYTTTQSESLLLTTYGYIISSVCLDFHPFFTWSSHYRTYRSTDTFIGTDCMLLLINTSDFVLVHEI